MTARVSGRTDRLDVRLFEPSAPAGGSPALVAFGRHAPSSSGRPPASSPKRRPGPSSTTSWDSKACRDWVAVRRAAAPGGNPDGGARADDSGQRARDGERGQQRVRVEYQLLGPLSLVGERGMSGGYAAGVVLRPDSDEGGGGATVALAAALWLVATAGRAPPRLRTVRAVVTAVDLIAAAGGPESLVRSAIEMVGRPRLAACAGEPRALWALGLFADILVEEIDAPRASACATT